ncbi:hypothetical protein ACFSCW_00815 [Sphingomonas tabacisoli]|uniref:Uncharacterized protein n=1 Tax=Sphingomonas tabacisoli TaxID=2249466 RepID=A0ABW4HYU9_9SPHN
MNQSNEPQSSARERIGELYNALMTQIVFRLDATLESGKEARDNKDHPDNWKNAEFCYLQVRKVCEYLALAILVAHDGYEGATSKKYRSSYHAGDLFDELMKLNRYAFPVPVLVMMDAQGEGRHHVEPKSNGLTIAELKYIYGQCSDRLHVGTLKKLLSGRAQAYDLTELMGWRNRLVETLNTHMVLLPEILSVLLVVLKDENDGLVHCAFGDADGEFVIGDRVEFAVDRKL